MKTPILFATGIITLLFAWPLPAQTNDLTGPLQKGLFEEEANQNLNAAIEAYQLVIARFDSDRKLAATAVFRLAECYRKQGKTNEATTQYTRVLREFSDQEQVAGLARKNLSGLGAAYAGQESGAGSDAAAQAPPGTARETYKLVTSAEAEEIKRIQAMIKDSPDLVNAAQGGLTPLHKAAANGQVVVARFLLDNGAEVNARDNRGWTPLMMAAQAGHKTLTELLIGKRADVNARSTSGENALQLAAAAGFKSVTDTLLASGADVNAARDDGITALHASVSNDRRAIVEALLQKGANLNATTQGGQTPLHIAAGNRNEPLTSMLLSKGAKVNLTDSSGNTPLMYAVKESPKTGSLEVIRKLLENKADPNIPAILGQAPGPRPPSPLPPGAPGAPQDQSTLSAVYTYPVSEAVSRSDGVVDLLLKHGANPDVRSTEFLGTPLWLAVRLERTNIVKLLLDNKADPDVPSNDITGTPLHDSLGQPDVMMMLLDAKANVNATNTSGETPLHFAVGCGLSNAVSALVAREARVNARDQWGRTPLHWAAALRKEQMVRMLLDLKADPNLTDSEGKTPLDLSKESFGYQQSQPGPRMALLRWGRNVYAPPPYSVPGTAQPPRNEVAELLRSSGGMEDLPRPNQILLRRSSANYSRVVFARGTNDWNRFTLLELLASAYQFVADDPQGKSREGKNMQTVVSQMPALRFPDLARIRIRRLAPGQTGWHWQEKTADLSPLFSSGECSKDLALEWGDVVELPETDHVLNAIWQGFAKDECQNISNCLRRTITVIVKGKSNEVVLSAPETYGNPESWSVRINNPFWILPVLRESNLLLASSDLSRVKVTRKSSPLGTGGEWVLDCSRNAPAFWLRDGDVIEVPDK